MPELPEVETTVRGLSNVLEDRRIRSVEARRADLRRPFPADLGEVLARYPKVVVPEMNLGQLSRLLRAEFLVDAQSVTKVQGAPFTSGELEQSLLDHLGGVV